jgi:hypothetical protein
MICLYFQANGEANFQENLKTFLPLEIAETIRKKSDFIFQRMYKLSLIVIIFTFAQFL